MTTNPVAGTLATILAAQAESARITDDQYGDADRIAAWQERAS